MVWFESGLSFSCCECHACCTDHDDNKWVYLSLEERRRLALLLGLELDELEAQYCRRKGDAVVLRFRAGRCPFLVAEGCRVHDAKPVQCSAWPFWPENVYSERAWNRKVRAICPGAGQGRLWTREEIETQARRSRG